MASTSSKMLARTYWSKGDPNGLLVAKGQTYRERAVATPNGKRKRRGF